MIKRYLWSCLAVALLLFGSRLHAQQMGQSSITFQDTIHHFGNIAEEKGPVYCEFKFTNSGNTPLVLTRVNADCGCTTPSWPQESIAPGQASSIRVAFDPSGRPGAFVKKIHVYSNAAKSMQVLVIKGYVSTLGGAEKGLFAAQLGSVKVSQTELTFPTTSQGRSSTIRIMLLNTSNSDAALVHLAPDSGLIAANPSTVKLLPGEPDEIELTLNAQKTTPIGLYRETMRMAVNTRGEEQEGQINANAVIVEDFSHYLSHEEMLNTAPKMELRTYFDLGVVSKSTHSQELDVELSNVGHNLLRIHDVYCANPAVKILSHTREIKSGEKGILKLQVMPAVLFQRGWASIAPNINVICNDPNAPLRRIKVKLSTKR